MLSHFGVQSYTEPILQDTKTKGMRVMAEFGENLKRIREEKGMTQQTLADYLYVTRQAVSRWEGGSRYPDLMTAKKMAQFLETSVDELLAEDDMKAYVERSAILDDGVSKRAQVFLITLAFMSSLITSIYYLANYFIQDALVISAPVDMCMCILLTLVLGYSVHTALHDRLNKRFATILSVLYFGVTILNGIIALLSENNKSSYAFLVGAIALNVVFLVMCVHFFTSKKVVSPIGLYIMTCIYVITGIINSFRGPVVDIPIEYYRDVFMLGVFSFMENTLVLILLVFMAHVLHQKRKRAAR